MTSKSRYVLDTNVIISALLFPESIPGRAFFEASEHGEVLLSAETVEEIANVLRRPKLDRYVLPQDRVRFLATLIRQATLIATTDQIQECRDPDDDKWLELAVSGGAASLISGDIDLLQLKSIRGIPIITPAQFIESLTAS